MSIVPVWTLILGAAVFFYVVLDGFDLGIGILYSFAANRAERQTMMNAIAPIWDGNETWLVLGGTGLLAAFPLAFTIILPAVYFPILVMLLALIFRGVAFEFQFRDAEHRHVWDHAFSIGSALATFAQGIVLGAFIQGFHVEGRHFAGGALDCFTPFSLFTGLALMCGYALLGAGWLILKTEGALQDKARRWARICLPGHFRRGGRRESVDAIHRSRHRAALVFLAQYSLPVAGAAGHRPVRDFCGGARSRTKAGRRAVPVCDPAFHPVLSRDRHQPVPHDRASSLSLCEQAASDSPAPRFSWA